MYNVLANNHMCVGVCLKIYDHFNSETLKYIFSLQ